MPKRTTKAQKQDFLDELRRSGVVRRAVEAGRAGRRTYYDLRDRDEVFRRQWDEALSGALGDAEDRLRQIGEGGKICIEERLDKDGNVIARRFAPPNDRALAQFLAVRDPAYRRQSDVNQRVEQKTEVTHKAQPADFSGLSDAEAKELERLLAKAAESSDVPSIH